MPIRSAHSLRYIGGLSVNLNHLKNKTGAVGKQFEKAVTYESNGDASIEDDTEDAGRVGKELEKIALCGLRWFKLNVSKCQKMSSCQKDAKCQVVKHLDYGGGSEKK